jgi:hypothetical protein
MNPPDDNPKDTADFVAQTFFGVGSDRASENRAIRQLLLGALCSAIIIPLLFYLRFGVIDGFALGTTIFFIAYCTLAAIGLYFRRRTEFHTPVRLYGDWLDRIGAFWLIACVFGPFLGWILTSAFPLTPATWRTLYTLRFILAVFLPVLTAIPLTRYLQGKATLVALPILITVTLLPIWSAVNVGRDLWNGPVLQHTQSTGQSELYLQYTDQSLGTLH